ncbi:CsgE family curli-type amyloid fiber assembly protein [Aequorivita sp. Q41]|uniref:CsgE family curli-type amyloid fiber assembly protein n=1 Tax=Aequorivita sp. Q41 TaxID=3153300 RepID=UPI0032428433
MQAKNTHTILIILAVVFTNCGFSQVYNTQVAAKIDMQQYGDVIQITGSAINKTSSSQSLRYILSVIKNNSSNSNNSNNKQRGRFVLDLGEKKNLSSTTINSKDKDRIIILLLVYDENDKLLGMERMVINGTEEDLKLEDAENEQKESLRNTSPDASEKEADGVVLRGVVIEETKTKPGRDFYKMFYSLYAANNVDGDEIVTVKEVLAINNNTKIEIFVATEKVVEFFIRPQDEYLKTMSEISIKRVYWFLQKIKQDKNLKKYY